MKKTGLSLITFALLCSMSIAPAAWAQGGGQAPAGQQKMGQGQGQGQGKGGHPEIREAMVKLNEAKTHLHEGAKDFDGHKQKAIELIDQAEKELQEAFHAAKN